MGFVLDLGNDNHYHYHIPQDAEIRMKPTLASTVLPPSATSIFAGAR
jgi:hypothetical protein